MNAQGGITVASGLDQKGREYKKGKSSAFRSQEVLRKRSSGTLARNQLEGRLGPRRTGLEKDETTELGCLHVQVQNIGQNHVPRNIPQ